MLRSRRGNPFPRGDLICPLDFKPLTDHVDLDEELLRLREKFTSKYMESLVLWSTVLPLYDTVFDQLITMHQLYWAALLAHTIAL